MSSLLVACAAPRCGERGRDVTANDGLRYCVTEARAVIEGGISCPPELPELLRLEGGVVCAAMGTRPEELPPEVCAMLGGCEPIPPDPATDAGAADAAQDDGGVASGTWTLIAATEPGRAKAACVVHEGELVAFGGWSGASTTVARVTGAAQAWSPATGWRELPLVGRLTARNDSAVVSFDAGGGGVLVFGGDDGEGSLSDGALLTAGAWRRLPSAGAPSPRRAMVAAWTGAEVLLHGGAGPGPLGDGAAYDPITNVFRPLAATGAPSPRYGHGGAWTGRELVVFGGQSTTGVLGDGAAYDPVLDRWRPLAAFDAPEARRGHWVAWTGSSVLVWGGLAADGRTLHDGALYDPALDTWRPMAEPPLEDLPALEEPAAGWDGARFIVWGERDRSNDEAVGVAYDPASDVWGPLTDVGAPSPRRSACLTSGPDGLYVFGGIAGTGYLGDGAILAH